MADTDALEKHTQLIEKVEEEVGDLISSHHGESMIGVYTGLAKEFWKLRGYMWCQVDRKTLDDMDTLMKNEYQKSWQERLKKMADTVDKPTLDTEIRSVAKDFPDLKFILEIEAKKWPNGLAAICLRNLELCKQK